MYFKWGTYKNVSLESLLGKTIESIEVDGKEAIFFTIDGEKYVMHHDQDCCESVEIEEVVGDMNDLVGAPLAMSEVVENESEETDYGSQTWTFYKFATINGYVTIRWLGESNGYYSESVSFIKLINETS